MLKEPVRLDRSAKTFTLSLMACLFVAWSLAAPAAAGAETPAQRALNFTNQCSFDVWLDSVGSNASVIACTASDKSAQANCPSGFICYHKDVNTNYCVPGTTSAVSFPVTSPSQVTLDASKCFSNAVSRDTTTAQWGQCTCISDSGCPGSQICMPTNQVQQCYWGYQLPDGGELSASGGSTTLAIDITETGSDAIVASGNFRAKASCDVNRNCRSDYSQAMPATSIEYTFQNNNDWYDVSYINGINLPAVMYPVPATNLDYQSDDPYRCMAAGSDAATIQTILEFQNKHNITGNSELQSFACANDYDSTFTGSLAGFNAVYSPAGAPTCTAASDCAGQAAGTTCGLSLASVHGSSTTLTCGDRIGYWTYAQFCAANSAYSNTDLGIDCGTAQKRAYAECKDLPGVTDQGPGRSCFNSNTTFSGDTCCGFESWTKSGSPQPMGKGDAAVNDVDPTFWTTNILPAVQRIKDGCNLAYAYQFDDPYSTFTCATTGTAQNQTDYNVVLCPGNDDAGIDPPPPPVCTPKVPGAFTLADYTLSPPGSPGEYSLTIHRCDAGGKCTTPVTPTTQPNIYTATSGASDDYLITVTKASNGAVESCTFSIPETGCIGRASDQRHCNDLWVVAMTGAWVGRSVGIPAF